MSVKPATLEEIARLGATIAVTLYPIKIKQRREAASARKFFVRLRASVSPCWGKKR
jgi:hypothetical protein